MALVVVSVTASSAGASVLSPCGQTLTEPFSPWLDPAGYSLVPGGDFESGGAGWSFGGGARIGSGNEPYYVTGNSSDASSLVLPAGSSATSPSVCIGLLSPTTRLFVRNVGSVLGVLRVDLVYRDALGQRLAAPISVVVAGQSWQPTLPLPLLANLTVLPLVTNGTAEVEFRFTPTGLGAAFQVDDDYVDPYQGR